MNKRDILLVDDDACYLHLLSSLLRLKRFEVVVAPHAFSALELLENGNVGLLITDFDMPGMNGLELASCARERYPDMTVFMITASLLPDIVEGAVRTGISHVFPKPLDIDNFVESIRSILYPNLGKM